jgi:hypothetical protein
MRIVRMIEPCPDEHWVDWNIGSKQKHKKDQEPHTCLIDAMLLFCSAGVWVT